jgi:hypothetical protein
MNFVLQPFNLNTPSNMPTATVTLNVTQFNALPAACVISKPVISDSAGNRLKYADPNDSNNFGIIAIGKGSSPLNIAFKIPGFNAGTVTFTGDGGPANFPSQSNSGDTVTVEDVFANAGNSTDLPQWEYSIAITNSSNSAGKIDPEIENQMDPDR